MQDYVQPKILTPRLIVLLVILSIGIVAALYVWLIYVPYMRDNMDDWDRQIFEPLEIDGDGTSATPYLIYTIEELAELAEKVNNGNSYREHYFVLMNDIDMSGYLAEGGAGYNDGKGWVMIGRRGRLFSGVFDGAGHTISGLRINRPEENSAGFFGETAGAEIYRLNIEAVEIIGQNNAGVITGFQRGGKISTCSVKADYINAAGYDYIRYVGGITGLQTYAVIENCSVEIKTELHIDDKTYFGGMVGCSDTNSSIIDSQAEVNIDITAERRVRVGGLVGALEEGAKVINCSSEGLINIISEERNWVGGLVGYAEDEGTEIIDNNSSVNVNGAFCGGGLAGSLENGAVVKNSFATGDIYTLRNNSNAFGGGLAGIVYDGSVAENSYATGDVYVRGQNVYAGGLIGEVYGSDVINCYAEGNVYVDLTNDDGYLYRGELIGKIGDSDERKSRVINEEADFSPNNDLY